MSRLWIAGVAGLVLLTACTENDGTNPNYRFGDTAYGQYQAQREAALMGKAPTPDAIPVTLPRKSPTAAEITPQPRTTAPPAAAQQPVRPPATTGQRPIGYAGTPTVLQRYAETVDNDPGQSRWQRSGGPANAATRTCASFATPEAAQIAFIARGGPQADPLGLDPDGDGFVCGWDPRPLREAAL